VHLSFPAVLENDRCAPHFEVGKSTYHNVIGRFMLTVYYDGKCGLCRQEIEYYKKIAPANAFVWLDIANDPTSLAALRISQADALRRLHARDAFGVMHVGAAAFIAIWQRLAYWRYLALLMKLPLVLPLVSIIYNRFADHRFARLSHCQLAVTADENKP
jgi:predicted DCC family thiol-disulfide oxidoreductase YuxK